MESVELCTVAIILFAAYEILIHLWYPEIFISSNPLDILNAMLSILFLCFILGSLLFAMVSR